MRAVYGIVDGKRKIVLLDNRKCKRCDKEFEPKRQDSAYCCRTCSKLASNERQPDYKEKARVRANEWFKNNKEKAKEKRKKYYWSNPEYFKAKTKEWQIKNKEHVNTIKEKRRDEVQHGSQRAKIIKESKGICTICKKDTTFGWRDSVVHHANFDKKDHSHQILVCRACHARLHLRKVKTGRKYFSSE